MTELAGRGGPRSVARIEVPRQEGLVLRTERMILRALRDTDRAAFITAIQASRSELDRFMPLHEEGDSDDAVFERQLGYAAPAAGCDHTAAPYVRLTGVLPDGSIAGGFNINTIQRGLEWGADINWWIATPHAGAGLATEGVQAIVKHALADLPAGLGLHIVRAWITQDNAASARVAEKAGLVRWGEERSHVSTGGRWVLHNLFVARAVIG